MNQGVLIVILLIVTVVGSVLYFGMEKKPTPTSRARQSKRDSLYELEPPQKPTADNPYANPLPFDAINPARRARELNPTIEAVNYTQRMFTGTDETSEGLIFNTIPDPTLTGRGPYVELIHDDNLNFLEDHRPSITSGARNCADRFCRG